MDGRPSIALKYDNLWPGIMARRIVQEMNKRDIMIHDTQKHPTFSQYTRWLVDNVRRVNSHFTPQHRALCIPEARYELIIPLEYSDVFSLDIERRLNTSTKLYEFM